MQGIEKSTLDRADIQRTSIKGKYIKAFTKYWTENNKNRNI